MIGIFNGRHLFDGDGSVFAQINVSIRDHLHEFNTGKNANPFIVFMAIALHTNEDGWAWPSRDLIKKETGIKSDAAITSALRHLRCMRIGGARVFAHYRVKTDAGRWGQSAYLIFPDMSHGEPPFENMREFSTDQKPPIDNPLVDNPQMDNLALQEEPSKQKPSLSLGAAIASPQPPTATESEPEPEQEPEQKPKRRRSKRQLERDEMSNALLELSYGLEPSEFDVLSSAAASNIRRATTKWLKLGKSPDDINAFGEWWYRNDWRGKKGQRPTLKQLGDCWGGFEASKNKGENKSGIDWSKHETVFV